MTTIAFIRHGVTAWNKEGRAQGSSNIPLDEEGVWMAEKVAERLATERWDAIYTSPLIRASMTARKIAAKFPTIPFKEDDRLREVGGGLIEGTTEEERIAQWGKNWRTLDLGMETKEHVSARGHLFLQDIQQTHPTEHVIVVSHGSFIRRVIVDLMESDAYYIVPHNTSLTIVQLNKEHVVCPLFNCDKHLK